MCVCYTVYTLTLNNTVFRGSQVMNPTYHPWNWISKKMVTTVLTSIQLAVESPSKATTITLHLKYNIKVAWRESLVDLFRWLLPVHMVVFLTAGWLDFGMRLIRRRWKGCQFWDVPFTILRKGCRFQKLCLPELGYRIWFLALFF